MVNVFQMNKKYGEWAEKTIYNYFKGNSDKIKLDMFYFGSQRDTRKKDLTDAPSRPDFIILKNEKIKEMENRYGISFNNPDLLKLFNLIKISDEDKEILKQHPEYWMTKILDDEKIMKDIIKNIFCMIEIKSGFGLFNKKKYEKGKLNIMVAKDFKERIDKIQKKFSVKFNTYAIYVLLDRAYISNIEKIYGSDGADTEYSYERRGKNENKKQMFRTITFNKSDFFIYLNRRRPE